MNDHRTCRPSMQARANPQKQTAWSSFPAHFARQESRRASRLWGMVWENRTTGTLHRAAQAVLVKVGRGIGRFKDEKRYSWLGTSLGRRPARGTWELISSIDDKRASARVARLQSDESRRVESDGSRTAWQKLYPRLGRICLGENRGVRSSSHRFLESPTDTWGMGSGFRLRRAYRMLQLVALAARMRRS